MSDSKVIESLFLKFNKLNLLEKNSTKIIIMLGCLGDLDSFEYIQNFTNINLDVSTNNLEYYVFAIGDSSSKELFCNFTNLDKSRLYLLSDSEFHQELKLSPGLNLPVPSLLNLLLMCAGISSPGTLVEVLRGYTGDKSSQQIFYDNDTINLGFIPKFTGKTFDKAGGKGFLRPFELATRRLLNMIEVLSHWKTYFPYEDLIVARGGTFILDDKNEVIYSYRPKGLLGYSSNMSFPLSCINEFIG